MSSNMKNRKKILLISDFDHFLLSNLKIELEKADVLVEHRFFCQVGRKNRFKYLYNMILSFIYILFYSRNFECVSYHYATKYMIIVDIAARLRKVRRVCTIWGSEILKANISDRIRILNWYKTLDEVSVTNSGFLELLNSIEVNKTTTSFGLSALSNIDEERNNRRKDETTNVVVGTNASKNQQHLEIIDQLQLLPQSILGQFNFIFPMTYGGDVEYISKVKESFFLKLNVSGEFIEKTLTDKELAELRIKTDVLLQLQQTDQLSAAMTESIYAGAHVVTGNWLQYKVLDDLNIKWTKVSTLSELVKVFSEIRLLNVFEKCENCSSIAAKFSWSVHIGSWIKFLIKDK